MTDYDDEDLTGVPPDWQIHLFYVVLIGLLVVFVVAWPWGTR